MKLTRHHSLISSFVSCLVCFPCSFAPCYEVLMMPEPFEEFRYSGCGASSHGLQPVVLCLWLPLSFDLELQLCLASGAVGCHFSWNCGWSHSKFGLRQALWNFFTLQEPENSTILPGPRAVLNDDGGFCLWPPVIVIF